MTTPDPRIAAYIAEIERPGIPWISTSHITLSGLQSEHGAALIQQLIDAYFAAKRSSAHIRSSL